MNATPTTRTTATAKATGTTAVAPKAAADKTVTKRPRGFAAMDPATQRRIASEGGRASHQSGRGHRFTSEEARAAGRKGGQATRSTATSKTAASKTAE
ncbi:KGG domain-containing protein [Hymenobacter actinosclerus]|uniref:Stress-induced acidophilic repeat motif-containing protein n=1 Tax=Hymenobacter actinosclerus TaxID=82805 RepID=A0A1I0BW52_9BACT|nr:KGG domain-containing protein [Hymenobacter actinosclerus]SET11187.1 Stress-induced acidophilic repeat motif-containing protein [Hymenobacter actinosclerus]